MFRTIAIILVVVSFSSKAQNRLINFNLFQVKKTVAVNFVVSAGPDCGGFEVHHGLDSLILTPVIDFPGVCGNTSTNEEKTEIHYSPVYDKINYYKVVLKGWQGESAVKAIYVSENPNARMIAYPNPITKYDENLTMKLFNVRNVEVIGYVINQFGRIVKTMELTTTVDLASIDVNDLDDGVYVVWLTDGNEAFYNKFLIKRF